MLRRFRWLALALAITNAGCSTKTMSYPQAYPAPHVAIIAHGGAAAIVSNGATEAQNRIFQESMEEMTPQLAAAARGISICQHSRHIGKKYVAHCHEDGYTCFYKTQVTHQNCWHEFTHALRDIQGEERFARWIAIFERHHVDLAQPLPMYPSRGIASDYGRTNHRENLAEWVELILSQVSTRTNPFDIPWVEIQDKDDPIYREILEYLLGNGYLTQAQHDDFVAACLTLKM